MIGAVQLVQDSIDFSMAEYNRKGTWSFGRWGQLDGWKRDMEHITIKE